MATPASSQDIFDVRKIRRLVELMKEHDLTRDRSSAGRSADSASPRRHVRPIRALLCRKLAAVQSSRRLPEPPKPAAETSAATSSESRIGDYQEPDGRHVLRRARSRFAAVRQGRRPRGAGDDRLHRRGHEGVQPDSGRSVGQDRGGAGAKTASRWNSASRCSRSIRGNR